VNFELIKDIKNAYANLNPGGVRDLADKAISVGVLAESDSSFLYIKRFLQPVGGMVTHLTPADLTATGETGKSLAPTFDVLLCEPGIRCPANAHVFHPRDTARTVDEILEAKSDLEVALARNYLAFREPAILRIIHRISRENALFSAVTALPNVVPNLLELPWVVGEFASDTAFLTINQFRMAFLIAACHDHAIGYSNQKVELATIAAGAFGWRALARELIGKIPMGGGLIPKAAIAYAGSYVVGRGLDRLHRTGLPLSKSERKIAYEAAMERGKEAVGKMVSQVKRRNVA
jgi:hypothetical protein